MEVTDAQWQEKIDEIGLLLAERDKLRGENLRLEREVKELKSQVSFLEQASAKSIRRRDALAEARLLIRRYRRAIAAITDYR